MNIYPSRKLLKYYQIVLRDLLRHAPRPMIMNSTNSLTMYYSDPDYCYSEMQSRQKREAEVSSS